MDLRIAWWESFRDAASRRHAITHGRLLACRPLPSPDTFRALLLDQVEL